MKFPPPLRTAGATFLAALDRGRVTRLGFAAVVAALPLSLAAGLVTAQALANPPLCRGHAACPSSSTSTVSTSTSSGTPAPSGGTTTDTTTTTTTSTTTTTTTTTPAPTTASWSASEESGDLSDWYAPATCECTSSDHGGGEYDSGGGYSVASQNVAHTGSWSSKQTIDTSGGSAGTRLFRWREFRSLTAGQGVFASAWFYLPAPVKVGGYFNIFQFKSKTQDGAYVDVFFQLGLFSRTDGTMYVKPGWGWGAENPNFPGGPYRGGPATGQWFTPVNQINVPVGRWFKLSAYIIPSASYTGTLRLWQDGTLLYDFENVMTGYPNTTTSLNGVDTQWAVNAYGNGLTPSAYTQYVDDASISTSGP